MRLPSMNAGKSVSAHAAPLLAPVQDGVDLQGCSALRWATCGVAMVACGASCLLGPEVCVPCLAAIGMPTCLDCLS